MENRLYEIIELRDELHIYTSFRYFNNQYLRNSWYVSVNSYYEFKRFKESMLTI